MKNNMYEMFLEQYKMYSIKELQKITVANDYTEDAERAAKKILDVKIKAAEETSDKIDNNYEHFVKENYHPMQEKEYKMQENELHKIQTERDYQLHMDVHQLAGDIRFLKNLVVILLVIYVAAIVFSIVFILLGISQIRNVMVPF